MQNPGKRVTFQFMFVCWLSIEVTCLKIKAKDIYKWDSLSKNESEENKVLSIMKYNCNKKNIYHRLPRNVLKNVMEFTRPVLSLTLVRSDFVKRRTSNLHGIPYQLYEEDITATLIEAMGKLTRLWELNLIDPSRENLWRLFDDLRLITSDKAWFKTLKKLTLQNCMIPKNLPSNLEKLDLSYNQLYGFPVNVAWPITLKELNLAGNRIVLFRALFPSNLEKLDLSYNCLSEITVVAWPIALKELNLQRNMIAVFHTTLPANLEKLDLSYNNFKEIPDKPISLKELNLQGNWIDVFPATLPNVEKLDLSYNGLSEIPDNVTWPIQLKELKLRGNRIEVFPAMLPENVTIVV